MGDVITGIDFARERLMNKRPAFMYLGDTADGVPVFQAVDPESGTEPSEYVAPPEDSA